MSNWIVLWQNSKRFYFVVLGTYFKKDVDDLVNKQEDKSLQIVVVTYFLIGMSLVFHNTKLMAISSELRILMRIRRRNDAV